MFLQKERNALRSSRSMNSNSIGKVQRTSWNVICGEFPERDDKLDELLNSFHKLPVLEMVCLEFTIPDDTRKALEKRGMYLKRWAYSY